MKTSYLSFLNRRLIVVNTAITIIPEIIDNIFIRLSSTKLTIIRVAKKPDREFPKRREKVKNNANVTMATNGAIIAKEVGFTNTNIMILISHSSKVIARVGK